MQHPFRSFAVAVLAVAGGFLSTVAARAEDWPQWRGPRGNSTSHEADLPLDWSDESGIAWKTELPEWGTSTPAIWGDAIFLTSQHDDELLALRLNRRTGAVEWTQTVGHASTPRTAPKREKQKFHQLHNLASPSPVTDGKLVVFHFGNGELAAYDFDGKLLLAAKPAGRLRHLHDLVGARQQPRDLRRAGDLGLHAGFTGRLGGEAGPELPGGPRPGDRRRRWKSERMTGAVRTVRRLYDSHFGRRRRPRAVGRDGRQSARRL